MTDQITQTTEEETVDTPTSPPAAPQSDATPEPEETPTDAENAAESDDGKKGNPEAAKWRVRFREAETELEALRSRVADMQAADISRLATGPGKLHDGGDLLLTAQIADLLNDEGAVDPEKVSEAVKALAQRKPHLARPAFEDGVGVGEKTATAGASWADVFRN